MARGGDDDSFRPRLGKPRARGGKAARRYLNRVLNAAARAGTFGLSCRASWRSSGGSFGRGASAARSGSIERRLGHSRFTRRVIIKTRIVKLAGKGADAARAHLRYIQREGVTRDGEPGRLYDVLSDEADGEAFRERSAGDRHQFRFIVSAEDADQLQDLKAFTRDLMQGMEQDLETRLDWVAVDHFNTGHPHTHVVLRGKDERGKDLVIARDYIAHGMRARAQELVTLELGPVTELEIQEKLRHEVDHDRFTSLDRGLLRDAEDGFLDTREQPESPYARFKHSLRMARLRKLERMGLAHETTSGLWQLADDLEGRLRRMGERGDIIKTLHRAMREQSLERSAVDYAIYDPTDKAAKPLVGRVVEIGLSDELRDRQYLVIDGTDGRSHYVDIGESQELLDVRRGVIVEIWPRAIEPRGVDYTIAEIAQRNEGRYGIEFHMAAERRVSEEFVRTHVRRLEFLRRSGMVERTGEGDWLIPEDYLERAANVEQAQAKRRPVELEIRSTLSLDKQVHADGATWLDHQLVGAEPKPTRSAGFGREVEMALEARRSYHVEQGLADEREKRTIYRRNLLAFLRTQELRRVGGELAEQTGLEFHETQERERVEGVYRRSVQLASGKYALIERAHQFTLVPWRPVLERSRDRQVSGILRGQSISWTIGRSRGGPGIS